MARVSFTTASGEKVSFQATGKRPRGQKRKPSAYNKFVGTAIKKHMRAGYDNVEAFKMAVDDWNAKKKGGKRGKPALHQTTGGVVMLDKLLGNLPKAKKQAPKQQKKKLEPQWGGKVKLWDIIKKVKGAA